MMYQSQAFQSVDVHRLVRFSLYFGTVGLNIDMDTRLVKMIENAGKPSFTKEILEIAKTLNQLYSLELSLGSGQNPK